MNGRENLVLVAFCTAVLAIIIGLSSLRSGASTTFSTKEQNPNKFNLWTTKSNLCYTFTYDPHAADVWRFQSCPQMDESTNPPPSMKPKWIWTN